MRSFKDNPLLLNFVGINRGNGYHIVTKLSFVIKLVGSITFLKLYKLMKVYRN